MSALTANRKPVKRVFAERTMLVMLVSFALSVTLTRFYLQLTGFPKIGGGELHIAHVLWGGLLLFIAALLTLTLANRWALTASAALTGVGVGLFIDEVGKFITEKNDYFYPVAAPIIYAFFLLAVWLTLQVRRLRQDDTRTTLYGALEDMKEVLDHDLDAEERYRLQADLRRVATAESDANLAQLASALLNFIDAEDLRIVEVSHGKLYRGYLRFREFASRRATRPLLRAYLVVGFGMSAMLAGLESLTLTDLAVNGFANYQYIIHSGTTEYISRSLVWITIHLSLSGLVAVLFFIGLGALLARHEARGLAMGVLALALSLTVLDLLSFYFNQFYTVINALGQGSLLFAAIIYRRRYLAAGR
ncbi:MAG: hypothetical protein KIT87_01265 [Anaerolineae bacterium]|nr:hypothetical protein [Anaerolineae bacterium]